MTNYIEQRINTIKETEGRLRSKIQQDIKELQARLNSLDEELTRESDPFSTQLAQWTEKIHHGLGSLEGLYERRRELENIEHDMMSDEQYNEMSTAADEHAAEIDQD